MRILISILLLWTCSAAGQDLLDSYTPEALEKLGDARYKRGQPDQALLYYSKSIEKEPNRISSILAAARILESGFREEAARTLFERVLSQNPVNPDALDGLSRLAATPTERLAAARKLLFVSRGERANRTRTRIRIMEALGDRPAFEPSDTGKSYTYKLQLAGPNCPECDPGSEEFLVLQFAAPNGEVVRLLIGTANDGVWLTDRAAKVLGAKPLFKTQYPWLEWLQEGQLSLVEELEIGDLTFRNCPVFVRGGGSRFQYGADGVIGSHVFKDFLIEIDHARRELRLSPSTSENPLLSSRDFVPIHRFGPFLLAPVHWDSELTSYFAVNNIASDVTFQRGERPGKANVLRTGRTHILTGWTCSNCPGRDIFEVVLQVAAARWAGRASSCKMDDLNRAAGFKVKGVLGYQFLRGFNLAIDYQLGVMGFIPQAVAMPGTVPSTR